MKKKRLSHTRSLAVLICQDVIENGNSLGAAFDHFLIDIKLEPKDRGFVYTLSFGLLRWYWQLEQLSKPLLKKPLKAKDSQIKYILLLGIFQLIHLKIPAHAAVSDTVKCCQILGKVWAKSLINGCLRSFIRNYQDISNIDQLARYSHPIWLHDKIVAAWPEQSEAILQANNQPAPLCLRVNRRLCDRQDYLTLLTANNIQAETDPYSDIGIRISQSLPVSSLPKFDQGIVSVQDTASQLINQLLCIESQQRVLDACAAPGGKTALIIENSPNDIELHAVDIDKQRNNKLLSTLSRLSLNATIITGNAAEPISWWDEKPYQRILLDAPCTGLGIIRRHPDIKHLRAPADIPALLETQAKLLISCWEMLANNGLLLYTTCSILPEENTRQIEKFLQNRSDVVTEPIELPNAVPQKFGLQMLPGYSDMDGFYYCLLRKVSE